ncbi:MAG: DEAD/DEAH box helicase [Desulfovibrio sp.]|nr:DEAD/DEAH box helicase [Desulfovibrio sp.]
MSDESKQINEIAAESQSENFSVHEPEKPLARISFDELSPSMQSACERAGWSSLMPVQSLSIPYLVNRRDLKIQSRTGSGKTGCYLLPMLDLLDHSVRRVQLLILVPTRELALQVAHESEILCLEAGFTTVALYGGVGFGQQREALDGGAQIVVGTPGRVLDHLERRTLSLASLTELVLDEADHMLSIGFYPDMKEIQRHFPDRELHTILLSATYPPHVLTLAGEFMRSPDMLSLSHDEVHVASTEHCFCQVDRMDKDRALIRLIERENPSSAIIFCNTRANVKFVSDVLKGFGYNAEGLSSDLSQRQRESVLASIREGALTYLVATDVASRGIDIPNLSHVFLYEPPEDHESYIHRAGRTGRCGSAGMVISLVDVMEKMELERIGRHYGINFLEMPVPTDEDVMDIVTRRLRTILETRYRKLSSLEKIRIDRYRMMARSFLEHDEESEDDGVALLALLLDAFHHETLHMQLLPAAASATHKKKRRRSRKASPIQNQKERAK